MSFDVESHLGAVERCVSSLERDGRARACGHARAQLRYDTRGLVGRSDEPRAYSALVSADQRRTRAWRPAISWKAMQAA